MLSGDEGESAEVILPAYMEPPSANEAPKCSSWLQSIVGGRRPAKRDAIKTTFYLSTRFAFETKCLFTAFYSALQTKCKGKDKNQPF
jgi:hypothetical protein